METTRTYDFQSSFTFEKIVDNAYRRIQKSPSLITPEDVEFCRDICNMEIRQWQSKHVTLYLIQREMFTFVNNQVFYQVPKYVYRPVEVTKISFVRPLTTSSGGAIGTAISSEGDASPCFNPSSTVGLTQTLPDGFIGFEYNTANPQAIWYVGILTLETRNYKINIEYSLDGNTWQVAKKCPEDTYYVNQARWWVVEVPLVTRWWRIREVGGATLAIQQLYFNVPNPGQADITMGHISRESFINYPQKINPNATPTAIYYNEKINRSIYVYGNNYNSWNGLVYTARIYAQDVGHLMENIDVDDKYYRAIVAALAYNLALQNSSPNLGALKADYDEVYAAMSDDDGEMVPLTMSVNLMNNWTNV